MDLNEKLIVLMRSGLTREAASVILDISDEQAATELEVPATPDPASGGGGASADPTVAPTFVGFYQDANTLLLQDVTGWKAGCYATCGIPGSGTPPNNELAVIALYILDSDGGTFYQATGPGA